MENARVLGLRPLARFGSGAAAGDDPVTMLTVPIPEIAKVLSRADLSLDGIGAYEVNEAFASGPFARAIGTSAGRERLNPLGVLSPGQSLGASGTILMAPLPPPHARFGQPV